MHQSRVARFSIALLGVQGVVQAASPGPSVQPADAHVLDIPAQSLNDTLQSFALASNHELLYPANLVNGVNSTALKGSFTTDEAVRRFLSTLR